MSRDWDQQQHNNAENIELKEKKHKKKKKLKKENADDTHCKSSYSNPENGVDSVPVPSNDSELSKKKHKKKTKSKTTEESMGALDGTFQKDSDSETKPEKLQKCKHAVGKKRKAEVIEEITTANGVKETNSSAKKRKSNFSDTVPEQSSSENSTLKHKKKKKAKKNDQEIDELNSSAPERKKGKKHEACETNTEAIEIIQSEAMGINENGETSVKKRKKHRKRMKEATEDSMITNICSSEAPAAIQDNETTVKKKKKHKKQKYASCAHAENEEEEGPSVTSIKVDKNTTESFCSEKDQTHKKSKKHTKNKTSTETIVNCAAEIITEDPSVGRTKHKKKKKSKEKDDPQEEHAKKSLIHATSSKSADFPEDDGNILQPKVTSITDDSSAAAASQWGGNLFESNERQDKFLRLLGAKKNSGAKPGEPKKLFSSTSSGPKKGLFGSLAPKASTGNAALSATAAADLNQRLEDEYNKAMNFKLTGKKGAGFGFAPDPAEGKKFHIDISKSKSVKFDD